MELQGTIYLHLAHIFCIYNDSQHDLFKLLTTLSITDELELNMLHTKVHLSVDEFPSTIT